jgi:hypothetical protein
MRSAWHGNDRLGYGGAVGDGAGAVRAKMDGVITGSGALTVQADGDNLAMRMPSWATELPRR